MAKVLANKSCSIQPYSRLKGQINIYRGSVQHKRNLDMLVWGIKKNCSCAFLAILNVFSEAQQHSDFMQKMTTHAELQDKTFQDRFSKIVKMATSVNEDLEARNPRALICLHGLAIIRGNPGTVLETAFQQMLMALWSEEPIRDDYTQAIEVAQQLAINTDFENDTSSIRIACMNAIQILSPSYYYNESTELVLRHFLLWKVAFVTLQKQHKRPRHLDLKTISKVTHKDDHFIEWQHSPLCDSVHPTKSVMWFALLQREHGTGERGALNHYERLSFHGGCCPMQFFDLEGAC